MSKPLAALLLLAFALPALAAQSYPYWAQTTSNLNVRRGDEIIGQLAKGHKVYVLRPDAEEGWVQIQYGYDPTLQNRVSAAYLVPIEMPTQRAKPEVGQRRFLMFMGEIGKMEEVTIEGVTYPKYTVFDTVCDSERCLLIGPSGEPTSLTADDLPHSRWVAARWDMANDEPTTYDYPNQIFRRYYHGFTRMLSEGWFYWTFFLVVMGYLALFSVGIGYPRFALWGFLLLVPLWIGSCQGNGYNELQQRAENSGRLIEGYRSEFGGVFKPFNSDYLWHDKDVYLTLGDYFWVPLFMLGHVVLLSLLPYAFRGAHFLLVPHPAEKHLTAALTTGRLDTAAVASSVGHGDMANPPPKWVSENQTRRLDALRERFRAETGLLNSVIDWRRKKAELEDP